MRVLLTGFEPFAGAASNPSWSAVELLASRWTGPAELRTARLPTTFADGASYLLGLIEVLRPDLVIATGLAQGRAAVTPELIAINHVDARIPDNAGLRLLDVSVVADGPDGYFSTLPVKSMVAAMRAAGIPAALSYSAGTFVCNHVFYALMHALRTRHPNIVGGFVHVPASPDEITTGDCPTMPVDMIARALEAGILACLDAPVPVDVGAGIIA